MDMETSRSVTNEGNEVAEIIGTDGWDSWDAVPRDGPAVFVVDTAALDAGVVSGRWLSVADNLVNLHAELTKLLGHEPETGTWAIVDQVGLGALMAPETLSVVELTVVAEDLRTGSPG